MKRWIIGAIAPLAVVAVAVTIPVFAQPKSNPAPLWSEHQVTQAVPAPPPSPWVQLARELKPAVVNVSTKRVEEGGGGPWGGGGTRRASSTPSSASSSATSRAARSGASAPASSSTLTATS